VRGESAGAPFSLRYICDAATPAACSQILRGRHLGKGQPRRAHLSTGEGEGERRAVSRKVSERASSLDDRRERCMLRAERISSRIARPRARTMHADRPACANAAKAAGERLRAAITAARYVELSTQRRPIFSEKPGAISPAASPRRQLVRGITRENRSRVRGKDGVLVRPRARERDGAREKTRQRSRKPIVTSRSCLDEIGRAFGKLINNRHACESDDEFMLDYLC